LSSRRDGRVNRWIFSIDPSSDRETTMQGSAPRHLDESAAPGRDVVASGTHRDAERSRPGRPRIDREKVLRRCEAFLEHRDRDTPCLAELAAAAGVSERSLRTIFREHYGMSPRRFLHLRQLHRVHRELLSADPDETTVSAILIDHGVCEFGRFAGRYRRLYGEPPSVTLRAGRVPVMSR
jgi:AraC family ethanolamine operon transcriptional activator